MDEEGHMHSFSRRLVLSIFIDEAKIDEKLFTCMYLLSDWITTCSNKNSMKKTGCVDVTKTERRIL